jgi:hypothetical protein
MQSGVALQGEPRSSGRHPVGLRDDHADAMADLFARLAREPRPSPLPLLLQDCVDKLRPGPPSQGSILAAIKRRHDDGLARLASVVGSVIEGNAAGVATLAFRDIERLIIVGRALAANELLTRSGIRLVQAAVLEIGRRLEADVVLEPSSLSDLAAAPRTAEAIAKVLDNGPVPAIRGMLRSLCLAMHLPSMTQTADSLIPIALPPTNTPATWRRRLADTSLVSDTLDRLLQGHGSLSMEVRRVGAISLARDLLERGEERRVGLHVRDAKESARAGHLAPQTAAAMAMLIQPPASPLRQPNVSGRRLGSRASSR